MTPSGAGNVNPWELLNGSPDGAKIFFDQGGQIFRLDVALIGDPKASDPVALPVKGFVQNDLRRQYDLTPDGKAFVMLFPTAAKAP